MPHCTIEVECLIERAIKDWISIGNKRLTIGDSFLADLCVVDVQLESETIRFVKILPTVTLYSSIRKTAVDP